MARLPGQRHAGQRPHARRGRPEVQTAGLQRGAKGERRAEGMMSTWHVYILRCGDGSFYTGIARDVAARLSQHAAGRGARYTRGRGPLELVHVEPAADRGDALRREAAIRRLGRAAKETLAASTWVRTSREGRPRPAKRRRIGA